MDGPPEVDEGGIFLDTVCFMFKVQDVRCSVVQALHSVKDMALRLGIDKV
jgi:hypothetical protein